MPWWLLKQPLVMAASRLQPPSCKSRPEQWIPAVAKTQTHASSVRAAMRLIVQAMREPEAEGMVAEFLAREHLLDSLGAALAEREQPRAARDRRGNPIMKPCPHIQ